jgi:PEP-CTERM motif
VQISGPTISANVDGSLITSLGLFAPGDYTWNLWPRFILDNSLIFTDPAVSDFAPDRGNAALAIVGLVPEPATLLSFVLGLLLVQIARKRKINRPS